MAGKYEQEQLFLAEIERACDGNVEVLSPFTSKKKLLKFKCKICGSEWEEKPRSLLRRNNKCPYCGKIEVEKNLKENYKKKLQIYQIDLIGKYKGSKRQVLHKCLKCGETFMMTPANIIKSKGNVCKKCRDKERGKITTIDEYNRVIHEIFPNLMACGEFKDIYSPVHLRCMICGNEFVKKEARSVLRGNGCQRCSWNKKFLTNDNFLDKLQKINPYIESCEEYKGSKVKINFKCLRCGKTFRMQPRAALEGEGCPWCNRSKGENSIEDFLNEKNIKFFPQYSFKDCKNQRVLRFDFYLPDFNLCIEYDGKQHYLPIEYFGGIEKFEELKKRDIIKEEYCQNMNINFLRIKYDEDIREKLLYYLEPGYIESMVEDLEYIVRKEES